MVFATQGADEMMQSRFVIDENIDSTEVHLYAVIDGYGGNVITWLLNGIQLPRTSFISATELKIDFFL